MLDRILAKRVESWVATPVRVVPILFINADGNFFVSTLFGELPWARKAASAMRLPRGVHH